MFKKGQPCESGREKLESQLLILIDKSDAVNPFTFPSDEEDAKEEMNVFEDETEIIMKICSFFNCFILCQRKKLYQQYFEFVNKRPAQINASLKSCIFE